MMKTKLIGHQCYEHLGGKLGALLLDFYISQGWVEIIEGKRKVYILTPKGKDAFLQMGLKIDD